MKKYIEMFTSPRFVQLLIIAILQSLVLFNVITSDQGTGLINIISALFAGSVVIRTIDRQSDIKADALKGNTTVSIPSAVTEVKATTKKKK